MRFRVVPTLAIATLGAACTVCGDPAAPEALTATFPGGPSPPAPFVLQFAGAYEDVGAAPGAVRWLEIRRDGSYAALDEGSGSPAQGTFLASASHDLPLTFFFDGEGGWAATVTAYDEALHVVRGGLSSTLRATCAVGPDEALCDATHGAWTDDDVDPATGLYCLCAPPTVYVPSEGGCVP